MTGPIDLIEDPPVAQRRRGAPGPVANRASPSLSRTSRPSNRTGRVAGASTADSGNAAPARRPDAGAQGAGFHDSSERRPVRRPQRNGNRHRGQRQAHGIGQSRFGNSRSGSDTGSRPDTGSATGNRPGPSGGGQRGGGHAGDNVAVAVLAVTAGVDQVEDRSADDDRFLGQESGSSSASPISVRSPGRSRRPPLAAGLVWRSPTRAASKNTSTSCRRDSSSRRWCCRAT